MRRSDHQAEFTQHQAVLVRMAQYLYPGIRVRLSYCERSIEEQARLIAIGASKLSTPEEGQHPKRLAVDVIVDELIQNRWVYVTRGDHPAYLALGRFWESLSVFNKWGGRFDDGNHFERRETPQELPALEA